MKPYEEKFRFKTLGSAMFDCGLYESAHSCPVVDYFHDTKEGTANIVVRHGMLNLPGNPQTKKKIGQIQSLEEYLKYSLREILATYDGPCELSEFYMSDHYREQKAKYL